MKNPFKFATTNSILFGLFFMLLISTSFSQGIFEDQNGKYGLKGEGGKILIEPKYDWMGKLGRDLPLNKNSQSYHRNPDYTKNFVRVKLNDSYGILNYSGEEIFPIEADFIHEEFSSDTLLWIRKKDKTYSFINLLTKKVINTPYVSAKVFSEGKAAVYKNLMYGYIDSNGKEIIPCNLDFTEGFIEDRALFRKGNKYGFIDPKGKIIIPAIYDNAKHFEFGMAEVNIGATWNEIDFVGGKWGAIDKQGKVLVPIKFDGIEISNSIGLVNVNTGAKWEQNCPCTRGGTWSVYDIKTQKIVYEELGVFKENLAFVKKGAKFGYINDKGELQIPIQFDLAENFKNKEAKVTRNDSTFFIDRFGVKLKKYDKEFTKTEGMILVKLGEKFGFLDSLRNEITKFEFDQAGEFSCGVAVVSIGGTHTKINAYSTSYSNGKYGVIDKKGNFIVPAEFENMDNARENKISFSKNGKWGYMNTKGEVIIEPAYVNARQFFDGMAAVMAQNRKWGFINEKGEIIIELKYDEIETWPSKGIRKAYIGKEVFKFDLEGKPITE